MSVVAGLAGTPAALPLNRKTDSKPETITSAYPSPSTSPTPVATRPKSPEPGLVGVGEAGAEPSPDALPRYTLDYDSDNTRCAVLASDAFARLNGQPVSLFGGEYQYFPPMGDDGGFTCTHPSVTLDQIPAGLPPPWTIEIGDSSQIVSATFGPGTPNTFAVGPLGNVILTSSQDMLDVPIVRQPGATTPAYAAITSTASDGQSSVRAGDVNLPFIQVPNPINPGWPAGPVTLQIDVYCYPPDALLGCEDASCAVVSMPGTCSAALPDPGATFVLCSSLNTVSTTTVLTVPLDCASTTGLCS